MNSVDFKERFKTRLWKSLVLVAVIIIVIFIGLSIVVSLLFKGSDDNYYVEPSSKLVTKFVAASLVGSEIKLSQDEVNGFLSYILEKNEGAGKQNSLFSLKSIYVELNNGQKETKVYMPFVYKNNNLLLNLTINVSLDNENKRIEVKLLDTKVGELPLSAKSVSKILAGKINGCIGYKDNVLYFNSYKSLEVYSVETTLNIEDLKILDNSIAVRITGGKEAVKDYISNNFCLQGFEIKF